jgi:hypothetical protein
MKAWVSKDGQLHLELSLDEASEVSAALVRQATVPGRPRELVESMADRIGRAVGHMLSSPRAGSRKPLSGSPAAGG